MSTVLASDAVTGEGTADDSSELERLFALWNEALESKIPHRVADLYAPNAVLVPTRSDDIRATRDTILDYFEEFLKSAPSAKLVRSFFGRYGNTPTNSGLYEFTFGDGSIARARYTFVYVSHGGRWLIATHHSSVLYRPGAGEEALAAFEF